MSDLKFDSERVACVAMISEKECVVRPVHHHRLDLCFGEQRFLQTFITPLFVEDGSVDKLFDAFESEVFRFGHAVRVFP